MACGREGRLRRPGGGGWSISRDVGAATGAGPCNQSHWQLGFLQFGDKVGRDSFPAEGFWVADHVVVLTVVNLRTPSFMGHSGLLPN
jgi:hypothetical protein